MEHVVIIGAGQGGLQMATSLRQEGFAGRITLIGDEPGLPYQRPPLSKAYMAHGDGAALALKPESFFQKSDVTFHESCRVTAIDRAARQVVLQNGRRIAYDHLVLATGTRNFLPPIAGIEAPGVLSLRTLADATRLREAVAGASHAVVIGGGFIGLEFAAVARKAGLAVTVLEGADRLMARAVSPAMSQAFLQMHRALGTDVQLGALAAEIVLDSAGHASGVRLASGETVSGDLVLVAAGVRPNAELAAEAGLDLANGVSVNGQLRSSDPSISALGDVCAFPLGGGQVRLESVQAAVDHARHIARVLVKGDSSDYAALPWFWSDQSDWKLQIAGLAQDVDEEIALERDGSAPLVMRFSRGRLVAVETVNEPGPHMAARSLIGQPKSLIAAADYDLRAALKAHKEALASA